MALFLFRIFLILAPDHNFLSFYFLILERGREGQRERHTDRQTERRKPQFVVSLTDACTGWLLYVPWPEAELTTLAYLDDALTNWATRPGPDHYFRCVLKQLDQVSDFTTPRKFFYVCEGSYSILFESPLHFQQTPSPSLRNFPLDTLKSMPGPY